MKRAVIYTIGTLLLLGSLPIAYSAPQWYVTYGAGIVRPNITSQTLVNNNSGATPPYNNDIYTTDESNVPALLLEVGKRWNIQKPGLKSLALGLQYQYYMPTDIGKHVIQYSSPAFFNYLYSLNLEANILLLNAKIELFSWKNLSPFINAGAGILQLTADDYTEYPLPGVTARTSPGFGRHANYRLTYQAGAGLNWEVNKTWSTSINYIYQPLTSFSTGGGKGAWSNRKLNFSNPYANSLFLTINYIF